MTFSPQKVAGQLTVCGIAKKQIFNNKIIKVKLPIDSRDEDLKGFKIFSSDIFFAVTCCYFFHDFRSVRYKNVFVSEIGSSK